MSGVLQALLKKTTGDVFEVAELGLGNGREVGETLHKAKCVGSFGGEKIIKFDPRVVGADECVEAGCLLRKQCVIFSAAGGDPHDAG